MTYLQTVWFSLWRSTGRCAWFIAGVLSVLSLSTFAQTPLRNPLQVAPTSLEPFAIGVDLKLNPAWQLSGLPNKKFPLSQFDVASEQGSTVLRVRTDRSYGVLTHPWQGDAPAELAWRWKLTQPLANADIQIKAGDDAALKVCVMFDQPMADIPFFQRTALALARASTGQALPSATVCYLWDSRYPAGTRGANPYSARVRYIVLKGAESPTGAWGEQRRRVADDFRALFGQESQQLPPVIAVAVGADSDNTQGSSEAALADLRWVP